MMRNCTVEAIKYLIVLQCMNKEKINSTKLSYLVFCIDYPNILKSNRSPIISLKENYAEFEWYPNQIKVNEIITTLFAFDYIEFDSKKNINITKRGISYLELFDKNLLCNYYESIILIKYVFNKKSIKFIKEYIDRILQGEGKI